MNLRPYQSEAVQSIFDYWSNGGGNPLVEMATGTGKSVVVASVVKELCGYGARVLMLTHVRELVSQNAQALLRYWPQAPLGINSAGLGRRDRRSQVLFASIQSVAREDAFSLGKPDVVLIDEAHLLPAQGEGQYLKLLNRLRMETPDLRVAGFTATPYRLDSGLLYGKGATFNDIVFSYGIQEGVRDGYLSPLVSLLGSTEIDIQGVARRGGEFLPMALNAAARKPSVIVESCRDMVQRLQDRRSWLVFCSGVEHAQEVSDQLANAGIVSACVTGETPSSERDSIIRDFKSGRIRALTNANVLTTGFDAPIVDAVVMMRPTLSTGLYVQMLGRGTRLFDGKDNCLVLDYAGNVRRHGPVDAIEVRARFTKDSDPVEKTKPDDVRAKECPNCKQLVAMQTRECLACGHVWPEPEKKIETRPERHAAVMVSEVEAQWFEASFVSAFYHAKVDGVPSMRIEYMCGTTAYREWVTVQHTGYAGERARVWFKVVTGRDIPAPAQGFDTAQACLEIWKHYAPKKAWIQVRRVEGFWRVVNRRFERDGQIFELNEKMKVSLVNTEKTRAA